MKRAKQLLVLGFCMALSLSAFAANVKTSVAQVSEAVSITTDVDYIITGETPFTASGSVNIVNTEHAVVIIKKIKPSKVISNWMNYIYINGVKAVNNSNCQVKMYDRGAIIFPYGNNFQPLTCYTENNFGGTAVSNYSEGHVGGYMKTLTAATLNNQIRSFKLKRGYMVTFALGLEGWGYSRCFIADQADLEMSLPANMSGRVSSYRIFKWHNAHKAGVASTEDSPLMGRLDGSWCYGWAVGGSMLPDYENVPNHIYEDWPTSSACGQTQGSCHLKTNNEPGNASDDTPQSVEVILNNWQNLMRTGLRLASETSHDGSWWHLREFIDSIDARGWRCDLLDLHCYWASGFDNMQNYYTSYGNRPIWISEWVWGASWNNNGIFSAAPDGKNSFSAANQQACYNGTVPILQKLNASKYVERYAYWNWEADASKLDKIGTLSSLGAYYAKMDEGLGYNASTEKIPNVVYRAPSNLASRLDNEARTIQLTWNDINGDMLDSMAVMCKRPGTTQYKYLATINLKDMNGKSGASYSFVDTPPNGTNMYRIAIYPIGNTTPKYSNAVSNYLFSQKAIWSDVSSNYITNPKFDISSDFQTANVSNGASNHKNAIGWTTTCTDANGSSAVFQIGSSYSLNGKTPPTANTEGNVSGGALGISQGWGIQSYYTQNITLPAGTYRFSYAAYNMANSGTFTNLCGYKIGTQAAVYDNITSIEPGSWLVSTMNPFTLLEATNVTLSIGLSPGASTSTTNPYLFFDYVKIEEADMTNVDDAGDEIEWVDASADIIQNYKFDITSDFLSANLAVGANNHKSVTSWSTSSNDAWGCGGVMKIGSGLKVNEMMVPALNAEGNAEGGALGMSQGWNSENSYKQTVTLPAGTYRLSYSVYNAANPSASFTNRSGYKVGAQAAVYDGIATLATGTWHLRTMEEFTLESASSVVLSLGFVAANSKSNENPILFFDYVKLEKAVVKPGGGHTSIALPSSGNAKPIAIYNLNGARIPKLQKGINIIQYSDGSVKKVFVKE